MALFRIIIGLVIAAFGLVVMLVGIPMLIIPPLGLGLISAGMTVMMAGMALAGGFSQKETPKCTPSQNALSEADLSALRKYVKATRGE